MRKIINSTYITLDGVVEGPHLWPSLGRPGAPSECYSIASRTARGVTQGVACAMTPRIGDRAT